MSGLGTIERIRCILEDSIVLKRACMASSLDALAEAAKAIARAFQAGHKLLLFGNGGSAADAQHIACEFVNRLLRERPPLAALALTTDTSILTSVANDRAFDEIFARQIQALGGCGDVAWGFTTSGASANVVRGLETARRMGMVTVGFTGGSGGVVGGMVDHWVHVPHPLAPRVQEVHIAFGHIICQLVDEDLFAAATDGAG
jgi:D-sedoheptulose 7-phosphate isomerase